MIFFNIMQSHIIFHRVDILLTVAGQAIFHQKRPRIGNQLEWLPIFVHLLISRRLAKRKDCWSIQKGWLLLDVPATYVVRVDYLVLLEDERPLFACLVYILKESSVCLLLPTIHQAKFVQYSWLSELSILHAVLLLRKHLSILFKACIEVEWRICWPKAVVHL